MSNDNPINLNTNDILGIIQRHLMELNAYCSQHPSMVDRNQILEHLNRAASFAVRIPEIDRSKDRPEARN